MHLAAFNRLLTCLIRNSGPILQLFIQNRRFLPKSRENLSLF